ncbi:MAG: histidine kinase, partial [Rhodothermales bacterium]
MCRSGRYLLLIALLVWPLVTGAQPLSARQEVPAVTLEQPSLVGDEIGLPFFFEHFTRRDYRQHHQNWAVVQDPRGVIFVANYDGILEYDGASWRLIETHAKTIVRSLAIDARGVIYAGMQGDFGYLEPDSVG